jgi:aspartyl-tRNA(Asn)/glutamyl-tRNA(Gln) amidotransferase subunit A
MAMLTECSATELLELYRRGEASPVEATRAVLARVDTVDPLLNSFCLVAHDEAMASAVASEARWRRGEPMGPLDGVPTSIKDLILTKGWPTRRGSHTVDPDQPWDVDAPATARLREAGAVLIGKTATPSSPTTRPRHRAAEPAPEQRRPTAGRARRRGSRGVSASPWRGSGP